MAYGLRLVGWWVDSADADGDGEWRGRVLVAGGMAVMVMAVVWLRVGQLQEGWTWFGGCGGGWQFGLKLFDAHFNAAFEVGVFFLYLL